MYERTEGWAAGLRLAVISLSGHSDPESFVAEFSGTDRAIGEYLIAEMLDRQPSEVQSMLLRTSVVERLNGELADLLAVAWAQSGCCWSWRMPTHSSCRWTRRARGFATTSCWRISCASSFDVEQLTRYLNSTAAPRGGSPITGTSSRPCGTHSRRATGLMPPGWSLTIRSVGCSMGKRERSIRSSRRFPRAHQPIIQTLLSLTQQVQLNQGRLEEAAAQLDLADAHVQSTPPARRRSLAVAIASLRLALARRSGRFSEVIQQVNLLEASIADGSDDQIAMGSELRAVALLNLGIVETWSGRLADSERHLSEGAELARTLGRPYLEVACRAHQGFPSKTVSVSTARERGRQAVALAERYGLGDRPILAPALGAVGGMAIWMGEFDEGERWLRRAWEVADPSVDPAATVLLHVATGMLHVGRGQHQSAVDAFAAAARLESQLSGVHALAPRITGWLATAQARLGSPDEARATLTGFSAEPEEIGLIYDGQMGAIYNARAVICLTEGRPAGALDALRGFLETTAPVAPAFTIIESHVLAGIAHLALEDRSAAAAAAEAALAVAEPDRLIFPFAMAGAADLLDALPRHQTAHGALLAEIVDLLRGEPAPTIDQEPLPQREELSPSELRVLRYLPTNLTRPEIASELYVSVNTVNTHIRSIYSKLGVARSLLRRPARPGAEAPLHRSPTIANVAQAASRPRSPDPGVACSLGRAAE